MDRKPVVHSLNLRNRLHVPFFGQTTVQAKRGGAGNGKERDPYRKKGSQYPGPFQINETFFI